MSSSTHGWPNRSAGGDRTAGAGGRHRVLALLTDGLGARGGIARYNADLMMALSKSPRVEDVIALPRFAGPPAVAISRVKQLEPAPAKLSWCARATRLVAMHRFDIVFCGHLNAAPLARCLASLAGARLWLQAHGIEAWSPRGRLSKLSIERADLVTSVSRFTRRQLLSWARIEPHRIRVLANTVAPDFRPRARRPELVARHGLVGKRVILTVGRLASSERYKGHDRVIRALPGVAARCPDVAYLIIGSGDDRARLRTLARDAGVLDRVVLAGEIDDDDLPDHYALADVFAMPSTGEGFGIVFLEAVASGLAVIGGNRDGSLDALADGRTGRLIDPFDDEALLVALTDALAAVGRVPDPALESERRAQMTRFAFVNFARHVDGLIAEIMSP